jgi:hypothetical protein
MRVACAAVLSLFACQCGDDARTCSSDVCVSPADATLPAFDSGPDAQLDARPDGETAVRDGGGEADAPLDPCRLDARASDGGGGSCICLPAPVRHRPAPTTCPHTRAPVNPGNGGDGGPVAPAPPGSFCDNDFQCVTDGGINGRCTPQSESPFVQGECTYDTCFADTDCPSSEPCNCDVTYADTCLPANCKVDSDCACGFCSPSANTTACEPTPEFGNEIVGFYCHTPQDDCTNDDQCEGIGSPGICAWQPMVGKWTCVSAPCAG